ncbi:hypothetical protein ACFUJY_08185 [Streptomyces sp. NPDC057249]|uniref:hypothetical protein n=1 Tax=Streptomyces sp. NPDC057249 TaxID=3346067 RepID=UPI00362C7AC1
MSDFGNPASLWPALPAQEPLEPQRWVWAAMDPTHRRAQLRELAVWVNWLRTTFELHNSIPQCWYRHSAVVEHLTALYLGWVRTYTGMPGSGRDLAEADWINVLHALTPRLQLAACATGRHEAAPLHAPNRPGAAEEFEDYLLTSSAMTDPAQHPSPVEVSRASAQFDAPL